MEKVIYLILSREKDTFNIIFAGDCEKTDDNGFFTKNPNFKCWNDKSGSENLLYLAIFPMFDSIPKHRQQVISKIVSRYKPICNMQNMPEEKPDYVIKPRSDSNVSIPSTADMIKCPCCGSEMNVEKVLEKTSIIKCTECGLSDTKLNS